MGLDSLLFTVYRVPMQYKRRIVYLSDPMWRKLAFIAKDRKDTISATVRDLISDNIEGEMEVWLEYKSVHHIDGDPDNNDPENLELR